MSEGSPVEVNPSEAKIKGYFKEVHDELTGYIGMMDGFKASHSNPLKRAEATWNAFLLDHIRYLYDLMEETILYLKENEQFLDKMPQTIADFEKHKPILDFIAETEMTRNSQLGAQDDK